jgi:heme exporter protein C
MMTARASGMLGIGTLALATLLVALQASREFYGVDHPVNLLFYYHVSFAWVGFAGLLISAVCSAMFLRSRRQTWSWLAQSATQVSFVGISLTLLTGMVWGRFIWNSWWEWSDIRLVTALVVWFIYAGYLVYHRQARDSVEYRNGAVFNILAFISVPITVASTRLWQSPFHSTTIGTGNVSIHYPAFLLALVGMSLVYAYLVHRRWQRMRLTGIGSG